MTTSYGSKWLPEPPKAQGCEIGASPHLSDDVLDPVHGQMREQSLSMWKIKNVWHSIVHAIEQNYDNHVHDISEACPLSTRSPWLVTLSWRNRHSSIAHSLTSRKPLNQVKASL